MAPIGNKPQPEKIVIHKYSGKSYRNADPVIQYMNEHSLRTHPVLDELYHATQQHTAAPMMGAPEVLQLLANLMQSIGAKRYLDVGVYTGCSALNAALALPADGKVVALDVMEDYVKVGRPFFKKAGVENKIDVRIAPALDSLDKMIADGESGTYDFGFIDADKVNYANYFERLLKLVRPGGIIAIDNVLWGNSVIDPENKLDSTVAIRELNKKLSTDTRVRVSMLSIGDGLTLAFVL
jgi:predicted O-methyltransferase YrrM